MTGTTGNSGQGKAGILLAQQNMTGLLRFIQEEIAEAGEATAPLLDWARENCQRNIPPLVESIQEAQWLIPVVGAFSTGKSSLLNAFTGAGHLPVSIRPETALAAQLRFGEKERIEAVLLGSGEVETHPLAAFEELTRRAKEFEYLRVYMASANLKAIEPLVLVDMPGFDCPLDAHEKAIANIIDRGAHYVFVTSVEEGSLSKQCLRRMQEVAEKGKRFSIAVTKTDLKDMGQVLEVMGYIGGQIEQGFGGPVSTAAMSKTDAVAPVKRLLGEIDRTQLVHGMYRAQVERICYDLKGGLASAAESLGKNAAEIQAALDELLEAHKALEDEREKQLKEARNQNTDRMSEPVLDEVRRGLEDALEELVETAMRGPEQAAKLVGDIVRMGLYRGIRNFKAKMSETSISGFVKSASDGVSPRVEFGNDWLMNVMDFVKSASEQSGPPTISAEIKVNGEKRVQVGGQMPMSAWAPPGGYGPWLAAAKMLVPIVIDALKGARQRALLRENMQARVIPETLRQLRLPLESFLGEAREKLIVEISEHFNQQIQTRQAAYETAKAQRGQDLAALETQRKRIELALKRINEKADSAWVNQ